MRNLDLTEMECIEGGVTCGGGLGITLGIAVGGFLIVAATGGTALLAMGVIGATWGSGMLAGYNCKR